MSSEPVQDDVVETVVDEDDDVNNDNNDADADADADDSCMSAEEKARSAAEARRRRIQEKANIRLATVSGEQDVDEEVKKVSASKAAKIRAARARRYGKKSVAATTTTTTTAATTAATSAAAETEENDETTTPSAEPDAEPVKSESKPADVVGETTPKAVESSADDTTTPAATTTMSAGKKYQGVAKMRRKMIAQKKAQEAKEDAAVGAADVSSAATSSAGVPGSTASSGGPAAGATATMLAKKKIAVIPVMMHILTVVLLFIAGLDVGLQQFADGDDGLQIHTKTAIQEYGLPFVQRRPFEALTPLDDDDGADSKKRMLEEEYLSGSSDHGSVSQNEFQDGEDDDEKVPIIDPLFRVDLDEYTKGPGIVNQLARGAIAIHRMLLWIFYFGPMAFASRILSIPFALMQSPPSLFITALVLRQVVGKLILGARLPDPSEQDDGGEKNNIDVLNMAKNFVKNFFTTSFPTAVTLYEAFTHVRADMYIALCGVFVGVAWTHLQAVNSSDSIGDVGGGSPPVEETIDTGATNGDEL